MSLGTTTWDRKYLQISRSWQRYWPNLITIFDYPNDIKKAINTSNGSGFLNSMIREATMNRKVFPSDNAARKVLFLQTEAASKEWTTPIRNCKMALNRFTIEFEERLESYV